LFYGSLKSPACSCVSITVLAPSTRADRREVHRRLDRHRDDLYAGGFRKRAFFLVATVTGIALERFDALTRDNRNHEKCGYSRFHTSIRCHRDSKRKKTRMHETSASSAVLVSTST
jgi:hypothetical protein